MTPNMEFNIPIDAKIYRFPRSYKYLMVFCIIIFAAFLGLSLALPIIELNRSNGTLIAFSFLVFAPLLIYACRVFSLTDDFVAINSSGIWYLSRKREIVFMNWCEIASISSQDYRQRLALSDASERRVINLEYQLENFQELREFVRENVKHQNSLTETKKIFVRSYYISIVLCLCTLFFTGLAIWSFRAGAIKPSIEFLGFVILGIVSILIEPRKIVIDENAIQIRYMVWEKIITYTSISAVSLVNVTSRGNAVATVKIERKGKRAIKLAAFKGGSLALYESIENTWKQATIGRENT